MQVVEDHDEAPTAIARAQTQHQKIVEENSIKRAVANYSAGMIDGYAVDMYEGIFIPQGLEPA